MPENKWPFVLEEVSRVLKPEGALEVVEEDLIFPGGQEHCTCHYPPDIVLPAETDETSSSLSLQNAGSRTPSSHDRETVEHHEHPPPPPPRTPPDATEAPGSNTKGDNTHPFYYFSPSSNSRDHSKLEEAYNDMHSSKFINLMPISLLTETLAHYFKNLRSHPPVLITFPPPEEEMWSDESISGNEGSNAVSPGPTQQPPTISTAYRRRPWRKSRPSTANSSVGSSGGSPTHSTRPLSPISPLSEGRPSISGPATAEASLFALVEDTDATPTEATGFMTHPPVGGWHTLHLDVRSLVRPRQPFIMIDRCRMPARGYGLPSGAGAAAGGDGSSSTHSPMTRLPNTTFNLDLQSLTLLLSQSVTDVLECAEAMWEYLVEQGKARTKRPSQPATNSHSVSSSAAGVASTAMTRTKSQGVVDRDEFDQWISKYEKEMHARIGMAEALRRRFGWETKALLSDYVVTKARSHTMSTLTPTMVAPTLGAPSAAMATTTTAMTTLVLPGPSRPRFLGEPGSEEGAGAHSSSSVSLAAEEEGGGQERVESVAGIMRPRTGSAPERVTSVYHARKAGKHVARAAIGDSGAHRRSHSLDGTNAVEMVGPGEGEAGGHGEIGGEGVGELEGVELPRLSRCIRVFVAWNGKD